MTLALPKTRDPIASLALAGMTFAVAWLAINSPGPRSAAASDRREGFAGVILIPTSQPTPALPTPQPTEQPVVLQAAPTPAPQVIERIVEVQVPIEVPVYVYADAPAQPVDAPAQPADAAAETGNPYAGMETVNGQSFVDNITYDAVDPTTLAIHQDAAEAYRELPSVKVDNAPFQPSRPPTERDFQYSRQRTR
jgi:hypothetical protein